MPSRVYVGLIFVDFRVLHPYNGQNLSSYTQRPVHEICPLDL